METELISRLNGAVPIPRANDSAVSDDALVEEARTGDLAAFGQLVERYETKVFRVAQTLARSREDAEEIVQDAFVKAFKNLTKFRGDSRFYTWLVRITINEGLMRARARRVRVVSIDAPAETQERTLPREIEDLRPTPEQRYSQQELRNILSTTIHKLGPRYRTVVHLREVEGLSTREIARVLDLSNTAVKSRLRRARLRLRDSLGTYLRQTARGSFERPFAVNPTSERGATSQFAL